MLKLNRSLSQIRYGSTQSEKKTKTRCLIVDKRAEKLCFAVFVAFNLIYWIYLLSPQKPKTLIVQ